MSKRYYDLITRSLNLPQFSNVKELSELMRLSESLLYCLSQKSEKYYKRKNIPKKDGTNREILIPSYTLKIVQRWILNNILNKVQPSKQAMAFRKGKEYNCKANALFHVETRYGIAIDLTDFFTSISANRVYDVFSNMGYETLPATILTNLCTIDGFLPQGGVCSPALSNLVCFRLDARLNGLCEKRRIRFSRYADDMYFSCDNQDVLKKTVPIIKKIIEDEKFTINERKVHYHTPSNRKMITGITIAKSTQDSEPHLKAKKKLKRTIRAEIFRAILSGDYGNKMHILGEISYVNYIEPGYLERIKKYVASTGEKIKNFPELVELYNNNLLFEDLEKINCINLSAEEMDSDNELCEYMAFVHEERQAYLAKHGKPDVCKYEGWDTLLDSRTEENNEYPF